MKTKKYLTLYHYSDVKIDGKISPRYFGENTYTNNDIKASIIKRLFFYTAKNPENLLKNCRFLYTCKIDETKIYDLKADKSGIIKKHGNITEILNAIIKQGFDGVIYSINGTYNIVNLFKSILPFKAEAISWKN